jgi:NTE family protein
MFGAYQAGAWKTLAPVFQPEMVVGSSAGALNGWLIAGGATADDVILKWNDPRMAAMMRLRVPWLPWRGIFAVRALESLVREMAEGWRPRVPYYATAVEVPGLRLRIMRGEEMTWRHLLAACAVPLGFPPVRIDGRLFVDGGLLSVLPTGVAAELGASHIVAVNALPAMPSRVIRGAVRGVQYLAAEGRAAAASDVQIRTIVPDPPLGRLADSVRWQPENVRRWIERGAADAARVVSSPAGVFV